MKRVIKLLVVLLFAAFVFIQLLRPNFVNPQVTQAETLEFSNQVPETVSAILRRSCFDCHSNETIYPWYANIQPAGWFLARHIEDGRRHLNFSVWSTYDARRKKRRLGEICEQVQSREMPLPSYLWLHGEGKLSENEINSLCNWANAEAENIQLPSN